MGNVLMVLIAIICAVVGIALILSGIRYCLAAYFISRESDEATAEITKVFLKWTGGSFCRATVMYYHGGKKVSGRVCHFVDGENYNVGESLRIKYNPKHPKSVMSADMGVYRMFSSAFFMSGAGFLIFGMFARLVEAFIG